MKNVIIFGSSQLAEIIYYFIKNDSNFCVHAFCVHRKYIESNEFLGLPLVAYEDIKELYPPEKYSAFVCMGYTKMNTIRKQVFLEMKEMGYEIASYRHPSALILTDDIGEGNIFMENVTIGLATTIGDGNVFYSVAHIAHHTTIADFNFFTISVAVAGNIKIASCCFFGNNCTVRNGLNIADYTLVGAGCYIDKDTQSYSVHVPARSVILENKNSLDLI